MKKHISMFPRCLGLGLLTISLLASCSQDSMTEETQVTLNEELATNSFKEMILSTPIHPILDDSQSKLLEQISKEVILLGQQPEFKLTIFNETLKQKSGDYDIELSSLSPDFKTQDELTSSLSQISSLARKFEELSGGVKLKLYYPRAQQLEKQGITPNFFTKTQSDSPEIVIMNNYNEDYSSPAYQLNEKEELVFTQNVTEDYAASNNVYVIGSEEIATNNNELLLPDDPYGGGGGGGGGYTPTNTYRTEGRAEYGGKLQITDINEIEHWTAGRLEMRIVVVNSSGAVIKDKQFPQRDRSNFKDKKWYDFNEFLFNWNTQYIGSWNVETWFEVDGGSDKSFTITSPPPSGTSGPTVSATVNVKAQDNNLGKSIVQFPDRLEQIYGISFMNFKRK